MTRAARRILVGIVAVTWLASRVEMAGQQPATSVFTSEQSAAGKDGYARNCASCHLPDLSGGEAPPLSGPAFVSTWGARTTKDLFDYIAASMPPGGSSLTTDAQLSITAFILHHNGAVAGPEAFTTATAVPISSLIPSRGPSSSSERPMPSRAN